LEKIKILHIHTDKKFISDSNRFITEYFSNTQVWFGKEELCKEGVILIKNDNFLELIELANKHEVVVIYGLQIYLSKVILSIDKRVKLFWRFFGFELYSKKYKRFVSKKTYELFKPTFLIRMKIIIYNLTNRKRKIENRNVINRIDYFLGLYEDEFFLLKKEFDLRMQFLPLNINYVNFIKNITIQNKKTNRIIIGNSANFWNNHIDILGLINAKKIQFDFLFSYGGSSIYKEKIKKAASFNDNVVFIEKFMSKTQFINFYKNHDALVINSYRQLAVGNIIIAIILGLKVYLNCKNTYYHYLQNSGILVFSIEEFKRDMINSDFFLKKGEASINSKKMIKNLESFSNNDFSKMIYDKITI
jgi:dTDP-N-acetylfucosamine:lipid II N-acetylfucosaminyltransferase